MLPLYCVPRSPRRFQSCIDSSKAVLHPKLKDCIFKRDHSTSIRILHAPTDCRHGVRPFCVNRKRLANDTVLICQVVLEVAHPHYFGTSPNPTRTYRIFFLLHV